LHFEFFPEKYIFRNSIQALQGTGFFPEKYIFRNSIQALQGTEVMSFVLT